MAMPSQISIDIITYWHYMKLYHDAQSNIRKHHILVVDLGGLLSRTLHPPLIRILTDYISKEEKKYV